MKLRRCEFNPLLSPKLSSSWENRFVFNPAVVYDGELFHMIYRAQGTDMVSRFGYAVSVDGIHFNRLENPVFSPATDDELYGVEDPRITFIDGWYYMLYTAYSPHGTRVSMAKTKNFMTWERFGIVLPDLDNKDAALFPEKIGGKYVMLHRIPPDLWLAFSNDLIHWGDFIKIASPRSDSWDDLKIGAGAPPIKTKHGWLLLYHGVKKKRRPVYMLGFMLLDLEDPTKVLKRSEVPVLEPELSWEKFGGVPNVVFSDAMLDMGEEYYIYYGAADTYIALAKISKEGVYRWMRE